MTTGREANVNSLRPSVCNFSEFPCPSNRGRFNLRLPLATVNQQLHCLALELLVVSFLNLLFLHGFSLFTLSFRVRKIRGGSHCTSPDKTYTEIWLTNSVCYRSECCTAFKVASRHKRQLPTGYPPFIPFALLNYVTHSEKG